MTADAAVTKAAGPAPAQQQAIAAVVEQMVSAWKDQDADGIADLFIDDGALILPGAFQKGRDQIRAFFKAAYAGEYRGTRVTGAPIGMVPLGPASVALLTEGGVIAAGKDKLATGDTIRASWILVNDKGAWRIAVYHNCPRDRKA